MTSMRTKNYVKWTPPGLISRAILQKVQIYEIKLLQNYKFYIDNNSNF